MTRSFRSTMAHRPSPASRTAFRRHDFPGQQWIRGGGRRSVLLALLVAAALVWSACAGVGGGVGTPPATAPGAAGPGAAATGAGGPVHVTLLHFNDIYEITPLDGGKSGGPARVATLRKQLLAANPRTLTLLAGDLLSPSAMGTAKVDGERLAGRQMVAVLNALGLDFTTFGNHELDLSKDELVQRIDESTFGWICGNITWADGTPIPRVEPYDIITLPGEPHGKSVRIGILGAVLSDGAPDYVHIADPVATLQAQAAELRDRVDVLIALTHLNLGQDIHLASTVPGIDLILGGHEHENWQVWRGSDLTPILKADANVRTVDVVDLTWDPASGRAEVKPELVPITDAIPDDPATAAVAKQWVDKAFDGFRKAGFEPEEVVARVPIALDGRESSIRNGPTALTDLIGAAMLHAAARSDPKVQGAIYNAGSIRIDDVLPPGELTQYDVIRILPFGGDIVEVEMSGRVLARVLEQGLTNRGTGGYLQLSGIDRSEPGRPRSPAGTWQVGGVPLSDTATYRIALAEYLLSGRETGLAFLTPDDPDVRVVSAKDRQEDVRKAVIDEIRARYGG